MKAKQEDKTFMVRSGNSHDSKVCHLAFGADALGDIVAEKLGKLSYQSKEVMRGIIEEDRAHVVARFRGLNCVSLYNEAETRRLDVYMVEDSRGA